MKENLIKARACFQECQEIDPEFRKANILEFIGDCVYKNEKEDYSKAIQFYEDALKIETTNMALAIKIGR
jgi:tetratricopeptide (TPR) repeat protein